MRKEGIFLSGLLVILNAFLVVAKILIGFFSNSVSVLVDGINNAFDMFSSGTASYGFYVTNKKSTNKYPHGYSRVEYLLAILFGFVVLLVSLIFLKDSLERLFVPGIVSYRKLFFYIILASAFIKLAMSILCFYVNMDLKSPMLKILAVDNMQDFFISLLTAIGFKIASYSKGDFPIDGIIGIIISLVLFIQALIIVVKLSKKMVANPLSAKTRVEMFNKLALFKEQIIIKSMVVHDYGPFNKYLVLSVYSKSNEITTNNKISDEIKNEINAGVEAYKISIEIQFLDVQQYDKIRSIDDELINNNILERYYLYDDKNDIINIYIEHSTLTDNFVKNKNYFDGDDVKINYI